MRTYRHLLSKAGAAAAALGVTLAVAVPVTLTAAPAGASESAFCHTLFTYKAMKQPTGSSYTAWEKWAKQYLPWWEKLASEAPTASARSVLNALVKVIKYEAGAKSWTQIGTYVAAHESWWANGWKAWAKDVEACAATLY